MLKESPKTLEELLVHVKSAGSEDWMPIILKLSENFSYEEAQRTAQLTASGISLMGKGSSHSEKVANEVLKTVENPEEYKKNFLPRYDGSIFYQNLLGKYIEKTIEHGEWKKATLPTYNYFGEISFFVSSVPIESRGRIIRYWRDFPIENYPNGIKIVVEKRDYGYSGEDGKNRGIRDKIRGWFVPPATPDYMLCICDGNLSEGLIKKDKYLLKVIAKIRDGAIRQLFDRIEAYDKVATGRTA